MASPAGILTGRFDAPRNNLGRYLHQAENKIGMLKNLNYIVELHRLPCAIPSPMIFVKTAFQSAPPALLSLALPGCTDMVKTKLGISPWHRKSISAFIKGAASPLAIDSKKFLYKVGYFTAEKYLWWWMLADVTVEFITTWESLIYQEQQCQLPGAGSAYGYFGTAVYTEGFPAFAQWTPQKGHPGVTFGFSQITINPGFEATIGYSINFEGYPDPTDAVSVQTWWTEQDDPQYNDLMRTNDPALKNGQQTAGSWYYRDSGAITPKVYKIGIVNTGPVKARVVGSNFSISFTGRKQGNTNWGCNPKPVSWPFPNPLS